MEHVSKVLLYINVSVIYRCELNTRKCAFINIVPLEKRSWNVIIVVVEMYFFLGSYLPKQRAFDFSFS